MPPTNGNGQHRPVPAGQLIAASNLIKVMNNDRMLFQLWGELRPAELAGILKQALIGNLVWQERLFQKMTDEWPRLQKNILSLKRDVANLDWTVTPYADKDDNPSDSAQEKAALVERALFGMVGDPTLDQNDFSGTIKTLVDAVPNGFSISEITWTQREGEIVPLCTKKIPARFYGYGLAQDQPDQLMLNPLGNLAFTWDALEPFPVNKFLIGVFKSNSNHPTTAAMLRALTPWFFAQKYGLKWFMVFAQMFGVPTRIAYYTPGDQDTFNSLCSMLEQMGNAGWGAFPEGAKIELLESKSSAGTLLPQRVLASDADEQCDIMVLGQTLTSSSGRAGGNRALGEVHADTERKVLNGVADFVKTVINHQLIPAILLLNYGETSEAPTILGVTEEPQDELVLAQRDQVLFGAMQLPVSKDFLYERHSVPEPSEDAELYQPPAIGPDELFGVEEQPELGVVAPGGVLPPGVAPLGGDMSGAAPPPTGEPKKATASDVGMTPSMQMMASVKKGLNLRKKHGRGGTLSAVTRARDIAQRKPLSQSTVKRMQLYFDSNPEHAKAASDTPEGIAHLLHGGNAGKAWCESVTKGQA